MSANDDSVAVVIASRDRPDLVPRAVRSALAQTHPHIEVVLVDDGSSPPIDLGISDARLRVVRNQTPLGPCAARNRGLAEARAAWVTFLDDDDELRPDAAVIGLRNARASRLPPPVASMSAMELVDDETGKRSVRQPPTLERGLHYFLEPVAPGISFSNHATLLAPTAVVREVGGFDESIRGAMHSELFLRLNPVCSLQGTDEVTYVVHDHAGNRRHRNLTYRADGMARTATRHADIFRQHRARGASYLSSIGMTYLRSGHWGAAVAWSTRGLLVPTLNRLGKRLLYWLACVAGPLPFAVARWVRRGFAR